MPSFVDRLIDAIYREVPASGATACLLLEPIRARELAASPPGTPHAPRESRMTRYVRHVRESWGTQMRFPNPLQAVILAGGISLILILGDPDRTSAPVYDIVRSYGGVSVWGIGYLAITVALLLGWRWFHRGLFLAYVLAASGYLLIALALAEPAWRLPSVSWLAGFVFLWLAGVHAQAARRVSREWRIEVWLRRKLRRRRE